MLTNPKPSAEAKEQFASSIDNFVFMVFLRKTTFPYVHQAINYILSRAFSTEVVNFKTNYYVYINQETANDSVGHKVGLLKENLKKGSREPALMENLRHALRFANEQGLKKLPWWMK